MPHGRLYTLGTHFSCCFALLAHSPHSAPLPFKPTWPSSRQRGRGDTDIRQKEQRNLKLEALSYYFPRLSPAPSEGEESTWALCGDSRIVPEGHCIPAPPPGRSQGRVSAPSLQLGDAPLQWVGIRAPKAGQKARKHMQIYLHIFICVYRLWFAAGWRSTQVLCKCKATLCSDQRLGSNCSSQTAPSQCRGWPALTYSPDVQTALQEHWKSLKRLFPMHRFASRCMELHTQAREKLLLECNRCATKQDSDLPHV